jgi:hypothetical protein
MDPYSDLYPTFQLVSDPYPDPIFQILHALLIILYNFTFVFPSSMCVRFIIMTIYNLLREIFF